MLLIVNNEVSKKHHKCDASLVERVRKNFHLITAEVKRWQNLIGVEYNRYKSTGKIEFISDFQ